MVSINTLLIIIAIGIWAIWYELRYGIEKRKYDNFSAKRLNKKWSDESKAKWNEFTEARKDAKSWEAYLQKETAINSEHKDEVHE